MFWIKASDLLANSPPYCDRLCADRFRDPRPRDGVLRSVSGPCIILGIDDNSRWKPCSLVNQLYRQHYRQATCNLVGHYLARVRAIRNLRLHAPAEDLVVSKQEATFIYWARTRPYFKLPLKHNPYPIRHFPYSRSTEYIVRFPGFPHRSPKDLVPLTHLYLVFISIDSPNAATQYIRIPELVQTLKPCRIRVVSHVLTLDLDTLVWDLIAVGCGAAGPQIESKGYAMLANGGAVSRYLGTGADPFYTKPTKAQAIEGHHFSIHDTQKSHTVLGSSGPSARMHSRLSTSMYGSALRTWSRMSSQYSFRTATSSRTFISARSRQSGSVFAGSSSMLHFERIREDEPPDLTTSARLQALHYGYYESLHRQNLVLPFGEELNWSGKGQHVVFDRQDAIPLIAISRLGSSATAVVEAVQCRRILLARKTIRCSRKLSMIEAVTEVYHLQNLQHFHIIQLVGSYLQGRDFAILTYPVADSHLGMFLEDTSDMYPLQIGAFDYESRIFYLATSLSCLSAALEYVHENTTKHMDIKPQNILVRKYESEISGPVSWRIYIADFGLSRSFESQDHSQTDGPTSRTPRYCAPEVFACEKRGRSADIFSLGCVFLEILTVLSGHELQDFAGMRRGDGSDESFHANLKRVVAWSDYLQAHQHSGEDIPPKLFELVKQMVNEQSGLRPTAADLRTYFKSCPDGGFAARKNCCSQPPEPYERIPHVVKTLDQSEEDQFLDPLDVY